MHLGDHQLFGKWTVYEQSTHVPLVIAGTAVDKSLWNTKVASPVELLDLYPTLSELAGLVSKVKPSIDGTSLTPLFTTNRAARRNVRGVAVVQYPSYCCLNIMSYGLRGSRWRYVAHLEAKGVSWAKNDIKRASILSDELYDMSNDPGELFSLVGNKTDSEAVAALAQMRQIFAQYRSTTWRGVWAQGMNL